MMIIGQKYRDGDGPTKIRDNRSVVDERTTAVCGFGTLGLMGYVLPTTHHSALIASSSSRRFKGCRVINSYGEIYLEQSLET